MKISPELSAKLEERYAKFEGAADLNIDIDPALWTFLLDSEQQLIDLMNKNPPGPQAPGEIEFSWVLYFLNHDVPGGLTKILRGLGMPGTNITAEDWNLWSETWEQEGAVAGDGSLVSLAPYGVIDPGWSLAPLDYILQILHYDPIHPFSTATPPPLVIENEQTLTIAVFGDWGTGAYEDGTQGDQSPSQLIGALISKIKPDICIHLGDVYYAGSDTEEQDNLIDCWPQPAIASFTLNSNHEMYSGANGYFDTTIANPIFKQQSPTSYFQIEFGDWILLGLDTAYYDTSFFYSDGAIADPTQIGLLNSAAASGKKIILFSHHNPVDITGNWLTGSGGTTLWGQVMTALGTKTPDYWYWGHQHGGMIYTAPNPVMGNTLCRCIGNAGIPLGNASWIPQYGSNVDTYMNKPFANPGPTQTLRVMNGFALLTITAAGVNEQWYYQDGTTVLGS